MSVLLKKIGEGTFIITFQKIGNAVLSIFISYLIIQYLDQYNYGLLVLITSIIAFASTFLDFGIGLVITSDIARYIGQESFGYVKRLIKDYFIVELVIGLFLASLIVLLSFVINRYIVIRYLILIAAGILFLSALKNVFFTVLNGFSYFKSFAIIQLLELFFKLILITMFIGVLNRGLIWVMIITLISSLIATGVSGIIFLKIIFQLKEYQIYEKNLFFEIIKEHGKWQVFYEFLKSVTENLRFWVINFFVGVNGVAIFNVALQIIAHLTKIISALESVLLPVLSEELARDKEIAKKIIDRSVKYSLWLVLLIMITGYFAVPYLLVLFFNNKYVDSIPVFRLMLLLLPAVALGVVFRPFFFHFREQKKLFIIGLKLGLIAVPLYVTLTYFIGIFGYAIPIVEYLGIYLRYRLLIEKDVYFKFNWAGIIRWDKADSQLLKKVINRTYINRLKSS